MDTGQSCKEARALRGSLGNPKIMRRIGCWNVWMMYNIGKTAQVTAEMQRYRISILGVSECRWSGFGRLRTQTQTWSSCTQIEKMMPTKWNSNRDDQVCQQVPGKLVTYQWLDNNSQNVIAVLLCGCKTWRLTKRDEVKLDTFLHKCLRRLLKIYWPMKVSNEEVKRQARTCTIREQIRRRRWCWIGHVSCLNNQQNPHIALTWAPEGKRTRGRPKVTWRRTVERERQKMGFATWSEAVTTARDRAGWRRQVNSPILPEET